MDITINPNLLPTIERLALESNITKEEYASSFLDSHLFSQYKENVAKKITDKKIEDVKTMEDALIVIEEAIRIRDFVPIVEEIIP